jgi:hypothetical protein
VVKVGLVIVLYLTTFLIVSYREHKVMPPIPTEPVSPNDVVPEGSQRAPIRRDQHRDAPHECGLSGAVGPEHG